MIPASLLAEDEGEAVAGVPVALAEVAEELPEALELSSTMTPPPACGGSELDETFAAADLKPSRVWPPEDLGGELVVKIARLWLYAYGALMTPTMPDSQWLDSGQ
jgi:hypothetical protein